MSAKQTIFLTAEAVTKCSQLYRKRKEESTNTTEQSWTIHVSVSPYWSRDSQDQTGLAWQPAPSQYPHRNTGKRDQTLPGPGASPAATSSEHWVLK